MEWLLRVQGACLAALSGGVEPSSVIPALGLAGLASGLTHCAGMCAPFVLSQCGRVLESTPSGAMSELTRLKGALLLPYHLGRMTTYAILGALAALLTGGVPEIWQSLAASLLLGGAGLGLIASALPVTRLLPRVRISLSLPSRVSRLVSILLESPLGWRGFMLGLVLGLLPCGMIYAALMAASGSGSALTGGLAMAAFAAGTAPGLMLTAALGQIFMHRMQKRLFFATKGLAILSGLWLLFLSISGIFHGGISH